MKNSASNPSVIQAITSALQRQAQQLLPEIKAVFVQLDCSEIVHQRISQQDSGHQGDYFQKNIYQGAVHQSIVYQGLTYARHSQFGKVMIKWQLSADSDNNSCNPSALDHEINILKALNVLQHRQKNILSIAPPILTYKNSHINILEQDYQLTSLVMPYYLLGSLAQQLSNKKHQLLADKSKQHFIIQAAYIIASLHKQGWLHNDIKPSNILLNKPVSKDSFSLNNADNAVEIPTLLLTDFALAERSNDSFNRELRINAAGTPAYLAPERWQGQGATQQSDIYAFGVIIYEILTGKRPFSISKQSSEPFKDWATQHCQTPMPTLPEKYRHYQPIFERALAKRIEKRYQSMEVVLKDLESSLSQRS